MKNSSLINFYFLLIGSLCKKGEKEKAFVKVNNSLKLLKKNVILKKQFLLKKIIFLKSIEKVNQNFFCYKTNELSLNSVNDTLKFKFRFKSFGYLKKNTNNLNLLTNFQKLNKNENNKIIKIESKLIKNRGRIKLFDYYYIKAIFLRKSFFGFNAFLNNIFLKKKSKITNIFFKFQNNDNIKQTRIIEFIKFNSYYFNYCLILKEFPLKKMMNNLFFKNKFVIFKNFFNFIKKVNYFKIFFFLLNLNHFFLKDYFLDFYIELWGLKN